MASVFPDWPPAPLEAVSLAAASAHLAPASAPLAVDEQSDPVPLPLFAARPLAPAPPTTAALNVAAVEADAALSVGAPVWALAWRPQAAAAETDDWLAVATGGGGAREVLGRPQAGAGALQLWRVPRARAPAAAAPPPKRTRASGQGAVAEAEAPPAAQMALLLSHAHGCGWDAAWWPGPAPPAAAAAGGLGLLAAAFGDGSVCVLSLPRPAAAAAPAAAALRPAWRGAAGGPSDALAWTLAWQPGAPHSRLAAGCTDGRVLVWDLSGAVAAAAAAAAPGAAPPPPSPPQLLLLGAPPLPLRALAWAPPALGGPAAPFLAAAGDEGVVRVWDLRQPGSPAYHSRTLATLAYRLAWRAAPRALLAAGESGRLLVLPPERDPGRPAAAAALRGSHTATALWGLALEAKSGAVALCGADGECVVTTRGPGAKGPAAAGAAGAGRSLLVAALRPLPQGGLRLEGAARAAAQLGEEAGGEEAARGVRSAREAALHRCAWAPPAAAAGGGGGGRRTLAVGGQAGVLRLLRLRLEAAEGGEEEEEEAEAEAEEEEAEEEPKPKSKLKAPQGKQAESKAEEGRKQPRRAAAAAKAG